MAQSSTVRQTALDTRAFVLDSDSSISARVRARPGSSSSKQLAALGKKTPRWVWFAAGAALLGIILLLVWLLVFRASQPHDESPSEFRPSTAQRTLQADGDLTPGVCQV